MEAVLFIGIQGAGKSSFFKERFFSTHVRISLDLLKTRHREQHLFQACLDTQQPIVIDNTNPTRAERSRYVSAAKAARYTVLGYYFQSKVADCLQRNRLRTKRETVSDIAILSTAKKLELPAFEEGFNQLFYVRLDSGNVVVEEWKDEI